MQEAKETYPEVAIGSGPGSSIQHKEEKLGSLVTCGVCLKIKAAVEYSLYNLRRRISSHRQCNFCLEKERKQILKAHKTEFAMAVIPTKSPHKALQDGNLYALNKLQRAGVVRSTARDPNSGRTLLMEAVLKGSPIFTEFLLENGANVRAVSTLGKETALHFAVVGGDLDCIDLVLIYGALPNACNAAGQTPMHLANSVDIAHFLVTRSCRDDIEDKFKRTPFAVATATGNAKLSRYLSKRLLEQKKREQARAKALRQRRADLEQQVRYKLQIELLSATSISLDACRKLQMTEGAKQRPKARPRRPSCKKSKRNTWHGANQLEKEAACQRCGHRHSWAIRLATGAFQIVEGFQHNRQH
jgi:DNA-binding protein H-NS